MKLLQARTRCRDDAGTTLAELLVSLVAGSIVLAAAAALFVPTIQNSDRARRSSQNLSVVTATSSLLQRQVVGATSVVVSDSGRTLTLCTFATAAATTRSTVTWTVTQNASGAGVLLTNATTVLGDESTLASASFSPVGQIATNGLLTATLVTSRSTGSGATTGAASTSLAVTASPRSPQKALNAPCP